VLLGGSLGGCVVALAVLFGCVPPQEGSAWVAVAAANPAPVPVVSSPRLTDTAFVAADGVSLPLRRWLPQGERDGEIKAVILALHGFGDYSKGFEAPAAAWAARGIATYAYDQRGFGAAPGHALWAGSNRLAADADSAAALLRARYLGRPLYLLGESMGGAVAIDAATGAEGLPPADVDGIILSAPAVWGRETMDLIPKLALWAGVRLFPETTLSGQGLQIQASDNLPMLRALARDPLVLKQSRIDTVWGLVNLMDRAFDAGPRLNRPLLLLYGAHDEVIPREAVREFVAHLPAGEGPRARLAFYPAGYHLLLRDLEGPTVAEDVAAWVRDREAPLPTRADQLATARPWPPSNAAEAICQPPCAVRREAVMTGPLAR
jgi:alpha-beta hydrolase superfamily lysophospholipase